jgi:hypothetical protein
MQVLTHASGAGPVPNSCPGKARIFHFKLLLGALLSVILTNGLASQTRFGTGFFVDSNGHLVTALHVVGNSDAIKVYVNGRKAPLTAELIKANVVSDLALLKVEVDGGASPLTVGTFKETPVGLEIFALGHPQPSLQGRSLKITSGLLTSDYGYRGAPNQFQFSAPINTGHSGGPVVDSEGKVLGIAIGRLRSGSDVSSQQVVSNVGFALKSEALLRFLSGTPTQITVSPIEPSVKKDAVDVFKRVSATVALVEARFSLPQEISAEASEKGEKLEGNDPAGTSPTKEKSKLYLQALVSQGFREPARTSVGFLMVRKTGLELSGELGASAVEAELMTSMDDKKLDRQNRRYQSTLTRLGFDCSTDRMSILSRSLYTGVFLSGEVVDRLLPRKTEWLDVPSEALENYLRNSLC